MRSSWTLRFLGCSLGVVIALTSLAPVSSLAASLNLWPNPQLELDSNGDGIPDFWNKGGGQPLNLALDVWDTNAFVSGSHSLAVLDDSQTEYGGWFSDPVLVAPGERYLLSFKRRYCSASAGMRVSARYVSSNDTFVSAVNFPVSGCQLTWEQVTAELTIPPGVAKLNLEIVSGAYLKAPARIGLMTFR